MQNEREGYSGGGTFTAAAGRDPCIVTSGLRSMPYTSAIICLPRICAGNRLAPPELRWPLMTGKAQQKAH